MMSLSSETHLLKEHSAVMDVNHFGDSIHRAADQPKLCIACGRTMPSPWCSAATESLGGCTAMTRPSWRGAC